MCSTFSSTTGDQALSDKFTVSADWLAPKVARDRIALFLESSGRPDLVDDARVCVSDAVTYMMPRILGPIAVEATLSASHLAVSVGTDVANQRQGEGQPRTVEGYPRLRLAGRLADESGITWTYSPAHKVICKQVWFKLHRPAEGAE
ncbi:hypothetical protein VR41_12640 [Streptomyces sp. NRRL B-1568]|nr:hypothetical protein VR41_12640 [Streptomyces sp. NRRL B-1568]